MFNCAQIQGKIAPDCPENLLFCATEDLQKIAASPVASVKVKARCCAVLFERAFFSGSQDIKAFLEKILPDDEYEQFWSVMPHGYYSPKCLERELWSPQNRFSDNCLAAVRKHFQKLFAAEGLIPVYSSLEGFLVPFELQESDCSRAEDWRGTEIPEWSECVRQLEIKAVFRLHCSCTENIAFSGNSMMLPALCAWWRKTGKLPKYSPFRIMFSGAFDSGKKLIPVGVEKKLEALKKNYKEFTFYVPESDSLLLAQSSGLKTLPCLELSKIFPRIQEIIEAQQSTSMEYALQRLPFLKEEVRHTRTSRWDEMLKRLKNTANIHCEINPEEYLLNLMLQSECCCHGGRTAEATAINEQAQRFAVQHGKPFEKQLFLLQVERLVILTDGENFDQIKTLTRDFEERLTALGDIDLLMRYHGTAGQIQAYGTLSGLEGFSADASLAHFKKAKQLAIETKIRSEILHDMNYIHLWYALFDPDSPQEEDSFQKAERWIHDEPDDDNSFSNWLYLQRQKYMALYRVLLQTGNVPQIPEILSVPKEKNWQSACIRKYRGALETARGNMEKAEKYFCSAAELLGETGCPILNFIRMTIYAEHFRSLKSEDAKNSALRLLENGLESTYPHSAPEWRAFLQGSAPFPGLTYWY